MRIWAVIVVVMALSRAAWGLIYLPEKSLESLLVTTPLAVTGSVESVDRTANQAQIKVGAIPLPESGVTEGQVLAVSGVMTRGGTGRPSVPRFEKDQRVLLFLQPAADGVRPIAYSQVLRTPADEKAMLGCIHDVQPYAQVLTDLANPKLKVDAEKLHTALAALADSKNAFTQILVGRLMSTRLAERVAPAEYVSQIAKALASPHFEAQNGACIWAAKLDLAKFPQDLVEPLRKVADNREHPEVAQRAKALLEKAGR